MSIIARIAAAAACAFLLAGTVRAETSPADRALIAIERPDEAFGQIRDLPERVVEATDTQATPKPAANVVKAMGQAASEAIDEAAMRKATEDALAALPAPAAGAGLEKVAERWAETAAGVEAEFEKQDEEATARKFEADLDKRPDKARIEALVEAMAEPLISAEVTVAARRIERALEMGRPAAIEKLKAADVATQTALVEALMAEGRKQTEGGTGAFSLEESRNAASAYLRARLTLLSEADVATLHAFYADPAGRAKRDALVATFRTVADAAGQRMLRTYLDALRRPAG